MAAFYFGLGAYIKMKKLIDNLDLKNNIGAWIAEHTQIERLSEDTFEIATTEIDSYGGKT